MGRSTTSNPLGPTRDEDHETHGALVIQLSGNLSCVEDTFGYNPGKIFPRFCRSARPCPIVRHVRLDNMQDINPSYTTLFREINCMAYSWKQIFLGEMLEIDMNAKTCFNVSEHSRSEQGHDEIIRIESKAMVALPIHPIP